ncbi:hypothetical protein BGX29_008590 [Mortierella sp. GBA35]|nr:hypothetical protein BGX29_008590 [Mortierella sp. GBA35]
MDPLIDTHHHHQNKRQRLEMTDSSSAWLSASSSLDPSSSSSSFESAMCEYPGVLIPQYNKQAEEHPTFFKWDRPIARPGRHDSDSDDVYGADEAYAYPSNSFTIRDLSIHPSSSHLRSQSPTTTFFKWTGRAIHEADDESDTDTETDTDTDTDTDADVVDGYFTDRSPSLEYESLAGEVTSAQDMDDSDNGITGTVSALAHFDDDLETRTHSSGSISQTTGQMFNGAAATASGEASFVASTGSSTGSGDVNSSQMVSGSTVFEDGRRRKRRLSDDGDACVSTVSSSKDDQVAPCLDVELMTHDHDVPFHAAYPFLC